MSKTNSKPNDLLRSVLVLIAAIATVAFNGISQAIPVGGRTSADVSNQYTTFFTPANYAFAIWGIIYLLIMAFAIYQVLPSQRQNPNTRKVSWLFILSCILNCVWITLFQYDQILISVIVIIGFLLSLIAIYVRLDVGHTKVSTADRWLVHLPFSVYLGWLCVATIANISVFGVAQGWTDPLGIAGPTWAAIMLVVASMVGLIIAITRRDVGFILVFGWAFMAIVNKQSATPIVSTTALIMTVVLVVALAGSMVINYRHSHSLVAGQA